MKSFVLSIALLVGPAFAFAAEPPKASTSVAPKPDASPDPNQPITLKLSELQELIGAQAAGCRAAAIQANIMQQLKAPKK